jgi:hypothetical protein
MIFQLDRSQFCIDLFVIRFYQLLLFIFAMAALPNTLEEAIAQAQTATQAALEAGYTRLQVELLFPELKAMPVAQQFVQAFTDLGEHFKVFFTDAGASALAQRDWGTVPFQMRSLDVAGTRQTTSVEEQVDPDDRLFLFVAPSSVEIMPVEQICNAAGERPAVLLNPRLEDAGTVGIGYAGRQLRNRFLNTFEPCYYLRPLEQAALFRCYPSPWQIWLEQSGNYSLIAEEYQKPDSEKLEQILTQAVGAPPSSSGFLGNLQRFLRALNQ